MSFINDLLRVIAEALTPTRRYLHVDEKGNATIIRITGDKIEKIKQ